MCFKSGKDSVVQNNNLTYNIRGRDKCTHKKRGNQTANVEKKTSTNNFWRCQGKRMA